MHTCLMIKINKPLKAFGSLHPYKEPIEWHFYTCIIIISTALSKYMYFTLCRIHETFGCLYLSSSDRLVKAEASELFNWSEFTKVTTDTKYYKGMKADD